MKATRSVFCRIWHFGFCLLLCSAFLESVAADDVTVKLHSVRLTCDTALPKPKGPLSARIETEGHDGSVTIQQKGNSTRQAFHKKPALTVKLDPHSIRQDGQLPRKFHLNNGMHDPSFLCEFLGSEVFRAANYPAPVVSFARLELNGRDRGVYSLVEGVTTEFLRKHFSDPNGNLYEGEGKDIDQSLDIDGGDRNSDSSDLKRLARAARTPNLEKRLSELDKVLDLDRFYTFMAIETLLRHYDGYSDAHSNYRLYNDPTSGRFVFIPHGMDQLLKHPEFPNLHVKDGLLARSVLETREGRRKFLERISILSTNVFVPEHLEKRCQEAAAIIRPVMVERGEKDQFDSAVRGLISRLHSRADYIKRTLPTLLDHDFPPLAGAENPYDPPKPRLLPEFEPETIQFPIIWRLPEIRGQLTRGLLEIQPDGMTGLRRAPRERVPAVLNLDNMHRKAMVRLKGHGSFEMIDNRPSFSVNLADGEPAFMGVKKLLFESKRHERTFAHAFVGYELFRRAGVPAPAVSWSALRLNGRPLGVHVTVEGITSDFLKRSFSDASGSLYEGQLADIDGKLELDAGDGRAVEKLKELARAARNGEFETVTNLLNLDRFLSFIATERFMTLRDGYTYRTNNYRLYVHPGSGKVEFIPHGVDSIFGDATRSMTPDNIRGAVTRAILEHPEGQRLYLRRIATLQRTVWSSSEIIQLVEHMEKTIAPAINDLPEAEVAAHKKAVTFFKSLVEHRCHFVAKQIPEMLASSGVRFYARAEPKPAPPEIR